MRIEPVISFARFLVGTGIRALLFALPVAVVAKWCGVPPTWQSAAFMAFCTFWSGIVIDERKDADRHDNPSAPEKPKRTVALLTPAEVAIEARKLLRDSRQSR